MPPNEANQEVSPLAGKIELISKFITVLFICFTVYNKLTSQPVNTNNNNQIVNEQNINNNHVSLFKYYNLSYNVDLHVYLSNDSIFDWTNSIFNQPIVIYNNIDLSWNYNNTNKVNNFNISINNFKVNNNVSLYSHIFIIQKKSLLHNEIDILINHPLDNNLIILTNESYPLYKLNPKKKVKLLRNLLYNISNQIENEIIDSSNNQTIEMIPFVIPRLDVSIVLDIPEFPRNRIPTEMRKLMNVSSTGLIYPKIYLNEFWITSNQLIEINSTIDSISLTSTYSHIAFWKWQFQVSMEEQWKNQRANGLGGSDRETDTLREILLETNPYLLGVTAVVTLLHSLFDILAFKNDIQFWRNKKDLKGLSIRSLFINSIFQTIILLYLYDNDTSYMILISSTISLLIEYWKLSKTLVITVNSYWFYLPIISVKYVTSYENTSTSKNDEIAIAHLLYIFIPLIIGYSIYSLNYLQFKSYYSFILYSFVGFIYSFGFILMVPQLYINYKLKSVAHMPWKSMIYKSLNTFIDDLFAFIIKMPWLHRLACFRDDIIFFIYLYQRWIYRVDYSRTNEYGQGGDENSTIPVIEDNNEHEKLQ